MATAVCMKRMARERVNLEKLNDDYFVYFENDNLRLFHAYVIGPKDTLYEGKYVKLKIEIPDSYPLVPPKVKFIQYSGGRVHPNLYVEGKVCLSILGTWQGEPWAYAMTIHTVLITIRSLLDNSPYKHEPGMRDKPNFNKYVQYGTWTWLLLDYLRKEQNKTAREFLERHVGQNGVSILNELHKQASANTGTRSLGSPYMDHTLVLNYPKLVTDMSQNVEHCRKVFVERQEIAAGKQHRSNVTISDQQNPTLPQTGVVFEVENEEVVSRPIKAQNQFTATSNATTANQQEASGTCGRV